MSNEQRHFTRIPFDASITISQQSSGLKSEAELIDISFKGILIKKPDNWEDQNGERYSIHFQLAGEEIALTLDVMSVHTEQDRIGFRIEHMDLDTATHLRRLVELNLGDESLLERELSELIQIDD